MREIKFRAWHEGRPIGVDPQMIYDEKPGDCLVWKSQGQPLTMMQYTGLKDKNGVEIFEGDIVKAKGMHSCKVIFERGTFRFNGGEFSIVEDFDHYTDFEIIGNIYDHPHLLRSEKE